MDKPKDSIRKQCQRLWIKALESEGEVVLTFPDKASAERARFAFYEALRKTADPRLAEAKDKIEVCLNRKLFTITLRHRTANPFFQTMEKVLGEGLVESPAQAPPETEQDALLASLARFESLREQAETPAARPRNPYFSREE